MHLYIWKSTGPVTDRYHNDGGLVIVAASIEEARALAEVELAEAVANQAETYGDEYPVEWRETDPDLTFPLLGDHEPMVLVLQDAGCC